MFDAEGLAERIGTISYIARLPDEERDAVLAEVRALGEAAAADAVSVQVPDGARRSCGDRVGNYPEGR